MSSNIVQRTENLVMTFKLRLMKVWLPPCGHFWFLHMQPPAFSSPKPSFSSLSSSCAYWCIVWPEDFLVTKSAAASPCELWADDLMNLVQNHRRRRTGKCQTGRCTLGPIWVAGKKKRRQQRWPFTLVWQQYVRLYSCGLEPPVWGHRASTFQNKRLRLVRYVSVVWCM